MTEAAASPPRPEATAPSRAVAFRFSTSAAAQGVWPAVAVGTLALVLRLAVLWQSRALPFFRAPIGDGRAYLDWAGRIVAGDWFGRAEGAFYQAPLYPYLLAALRGGFGSDGALLGIRCLQIAAAAVACAALVQIGKRAARGWAGLAAGLLFALYAPAITLDVQIAKESLALSLGVVLLGLLLAAEREPRAAIFFFSGVTLGLLALLRESALLLAVALGAWLWFAFRDTRAARRFTWCLAGCAGVLTVLGPVAARNFTFGGGLALTTAQGGPNFYIGNHAGATGSYVPLVAGRGDAQFERADAVALAEAGLQRRLSPREVSAYWWGRGLDFWRREPGAAAALLAHKVRLALQAPELDDIEAEWIYARASPALAVLGHLGHFGILAPLAALGLGIGGFGRRVSALLLAWSLAALAGLVLFYVLGRYRVLLLPPLFLAAGAGLAWGIQALRARSFGGRKGRLAAALAAALALAVVANGPGTTVSPRAPADANLALASALEGRFAEAEAAYLRALEEDADLFQAQLGFGNLLLVLGRAGEALPHLQKAIALVPGDEDARRQLALAVAAVRTSAPEAAPAGPEPIPNITGRAQ